MLRRNFVRLTLVSAWLLLAACASSGGGTPKGSRAMVLTQKDILDTNVTNLYDAVDRLRPRWLYVRGGSSPEARGAPAVVVYLNRSYIGDPVVLKGYDTRAAVRLRYLDGPMAASTLTGLPDGRFIEGAILLETEVAR